MRNTLCRQAGVASCRVRGNNLPVVASQSFHELVHDDAKGNAVGRGLDLDQQVDMVGHDRERRYRLDATPYFMEAFDRALEGGCDFVVHEATVLGDFGKVGEIWQTNDGHHVEERCLVVEVEKPGHGGIIAYWKNRGLSPLAPFGSGLSPPDKEGIF